MGGSERLLWELALILYGLSNFSFWVEIGFEKKKFRALGNGLAFCGVVAHLFAFAIRGIHLHRLPDLQNFDTLGLFAILILLAYFLIQWKGPAQGLGFFASFLAFLFTLISFAIPRKLPFAANPELTGAVIQTHIGCMIAGFGILAIAFCASVLYLVQHFMLHGKRFISFSRRFPPLSLLDSLINRLVSVGFIFLSAGIVIGSIWAQRWWGKWWSWDTKQNLALLTWFVYALYIYLRTLSGWKGKRSVFLIVIGFFLILATFLGTNFLPSRHHFV